MLKRQRVGQQNSIEAFSMLLKAGLFGRGERPDGLSLEHVDWKEVFQLSQEQGVVGLVTDGIETLQGEHSTPLVPQKWARTFIYTTLQMEQRNQDMDKFVASLVSKLQKKGINVLLVKGQEVAQVYKKPLWRVSGDIDLLLSDKGYQKAKDYLQPLASQSEPENEYKKHVGMMIGKWLVELHGSLRCGFSSRVDKMLDKMYDNAFRSGSSRTWMNGNVQIFLLGEENEVLYVFTHFLNHFFKGGVGIRQVCDWCRLLWSFRDSLDLNSLESRLQDMGLMSEWRAFGVYAVMYLGMPETAMPYFSGCEEWGKKAKLINTFILETGNLGCNRKEKDKEVSFYKRKVKSSWQRACDLTYIFQIFPLDTLRFFPSILLNGIRQK